MTSTASGTRPRHRSPSRPEPWRHQSWPWVDDEWRGWWGPNPPHPADVLVLTSHPRAARNAGRNHSRRIRRHQSAGRGQGSCQRHGCAARWVPTSPQQYLRTELSTNSSYTSLGSSWGQRTPVRRPQPRDGRIRRGESRQLASRGPLHLWASALESVAGMGCLGFPAAVLSPFYSFAGLSLGGHGCVDAAKPTDRKAQS
jgi:hypothetical protein